MSAKENPHELKQERRRRPRSCLSCCFSASPVCESDDLGSTLASRPEPQAHEEAPWFSWPWSQRRRTRKKKKKKKKKMMMMITVPVSVNDSTKSVPAGQGDKDKLHKTKSNKPRRSNSQVQHQEEQLELNSNAASQSTSLPKISAKYGTRSRQAAIPPSSMPDAVRTTTRTKHLGSSEPIQLPVHAGSSDRPAALDPAVGLSVLGFTLTIMLLCGRTCAIACLCACFYLLPLLRTATRATGGGSRETQKSSVKKDMESEEYKKRVVMEGMLERDGRRLSGLNSGKAPAAN